MNEDRGGVARRDVLTAARSRAAGGAPAAHCGPVALAKFLEDIEPFVYKRVRGSRQLIEKGTITSKDTTLVECEQHMHDRQ